MMRLKLWQKIGLGFGGIIILMIFGGAMSIWVANSLADYTTRLYRHPMTVGTTIRDIKNSLVEMDLT